MAKTIIHVTEAEAARDFADLLIRVRAGVEVIIEKDARPVAIVHPAEPPRRTVSESIALAKSHEAESGQPPVLDSDFAEDVQHVINKRRPWNPPTWE
jgi:antitoxin (DNA-binding transcriptional repressor) of toxin-antitoxin stability system